MNKKVFSFFILLLPVVAFGQFNEAIGTYKDQVGRSVQRAKVEPGFIAAGEDGLTVFGGKEASIVKTKPSGSPVWGMVYGGIGNESFNSIREIYSFSSLPVNGYAALGTTTSFNGSEDLYFVRTDLSGTPLYSFSFGKKEGNDRGHCLQYIKDFSTGGFGYIMVGQTNSYPYYGDSTDILIVKTDENGSLIRAKVMGNSGNDIAYWVDQTKDGGFIVTGSTTFGHDRDIFVVRLDKDLNLIWQSIYQNCDVRYEDVGYGIVENPLDGTFTVTGFTKSFGSAYSQDAFLLNLKPTNGAVNWMRTYGTREIEQGISIDLSSGGKEYVVSGFAIDGGGNKDAWVFKTDMAGNPIWSNLYGAASGSAEQGAEITNDGGDGYIFTGYAESHYTINQDYYLVNLTHDGKSGACEKEFTRDWKSHWPCPLSNFQDVDVYDLKFVCTQYEKVDYQARKCSGESVGSLTEPREETTDAWAVIPNPTSTTVQVLFQDVTIPEKGGTLIVSNRNGKIVHKSSVRSGDIRIPVESFPNDLYIVRFIASDGKHYQKKFIKK